MIDRLLANPLMLVLIVLLFVNAIVGLIRILMIYNTTVKNRQQYHQDLKNSEDRVKAMLQKVNQERGKLDNRFGQMMTEFHRSQEMFAQYQAQKIQKY